MAEGTGRSEPYGQLLIKAGVPLAVGALAALFYISKSSSVKALDDDDDHSIESTDKEIDIVEEAWNEVLSGLVNRINELQVKVQQIEDRFERYQTMKDRETMVLELKNMLQLEMVRGECLEKEVSSIESQLLRMQDLEMYGMDLFHHIENLKLKNERLKRKVKRYYRKLKEGIRVNGSHKLRIRDLEGIVERSRDEVEKGTHILNKMAEEICELQGLVDDLRKEKMEILKKLEVAEDSLTLKHETEIIQMEECKEHRNELLKLQEELSTEGIKLAQLRWANAFLRRRLIQKEALDHVGSGGEHELLELDLHYELDKLASEGECSTSSSEVVAYKKSVMKKPVEEGHDVRLKMGAVKANKGDVKSYGRRFSWDWVEEHVHGHVWKPFSSG